ncbi:MAG: sigma-70 family RNA polymerase sigma factor [Gemmatales bacterium]|nr:sigma-70 family RNA polymerase sigma factor [Gemmatales bacterium]MDW8174048.1 sigma-70 family RNA polymerase sigma factor [Gemmatales bacterium]
MSTVSSLKQTYQQDCQRQQREELILSHLYLVRHVLGKLAARLPPEIDRENLEAAGILGLVEAAAHFDPRRGVQFKTFAYFRIRGAILDELRRNSPLSQETLKKLARIRAAYQSLNPPVSLEALAQATGLTLDEVADALAAWRLCRMTSLDAFQEAPRHRVVRTHSGASATEDGLAITSALECRDAPEHHVQRQELTQLLAQAIAQLPQQQRTVLLLYHMEDLRLKEIAQLLQLSESRVCRLLQAAEWHVAQYLRRKEAL